MPIYKTKEKNDGKQKYRVVISYTTPNGEHKKKEKTAYGLPEAKAIDALLLQEVKNTTPAVKMTVQDLFNEYINAKKHEIRETSLDKTRRILTSEVVEILGDTPIDKLNKPTLQKWKNKISERPLAIRTKKNYFKEFSGMLNWAVKMEYIPTNHLSILGNFRDASLETHTEPLHYYTSEQFQAYIKTARQTCVTLSDWGYYVFFNIAFYTGMRKGEIHALKWSDIYNDTIHIRRSIAQKLKGADRETAPKNKSSIRDVKIPQPLIAILAEHQQRQKSDPNYSDDFRVCGGIKCLRDTTIDKRNISYAKQANLPHIRVHDFRHTHATLLINEGINIQEIARRLGHSDVQITWNTYAHLYPREEDRALEILNKIK